ncbi:MAG: methyltransferase domain-containing protein [Verrucomicrobia bacterium]|nr:methyltransferase domain-containing protein [Verrucomicrobiota bacterium]
MNPEHLSKAEIAKRYGEIPAERFMPQKFHWRCVRLMQPFLSPGMEVADLGCGPGTLLTCLASLPLSLKLHGCDLAPELVRQAATHTPRANVVEADLENLPFASASFHAAFATEVLEHLLEVRKGLKEIHRVLKPNGTLLVSLPNRDWFHFEAYLRHRTKFQPVDDHFYGVAELEALLREAGFHIIKIRGGENLYFGGGIPRLLEKLALLLYPKLHRRMKRMIFLAKKLP